MYFCPLYVVRQSGRHLHSSPVSLSVHAIGTSCHSVEDAIEAQALGAGYIIAGHIFETECKKGLAGRGTDFLKEICNTVKLPVYAIGGISADNAAECIKAGSDGICLMSSFMQAEDVSEFMDRLRGVMNG